MAEFSLIDRFFKQQTLRNASTDLGIGDDCALMTLPPGHQLALTTDTMVENVHFLAGDNPEALGHKLLAVNLSDLASMGALPVSVMLALTLPAIDEPWLAGFAKGFLGLAARYGVDLIGGDTTTGALTLTVQALGFVPTQRAMRRSAAQVGDIICVTGTLGDAGLGLKLAQGDYHCHDDQAARQRFHWPEPRIAIGLAIRDYAHACADISDGLLADLGHIATNSGVSATVEWERLPLSPAVQHYIATTGDWQMPLSAGDDYELCFTVNPQHANSLPASCSVIGVIAPGSGVSLTKAGIPQSLTKHGYEHFS